MIKPHKGQQSLKESTKCNFANFALMQFLKGPKQLTITMILCILCFYFWLLIGVYMFRNKQDDIYMKMVCNSILIIQSTHEKAIFTFL